MNALSNAIERIRYRYGDPHKVEEGIDDITWNYYDPEYPDVPSLIVCFEEGVLATIFDVDSNTRVLSCRYPILNPERAKAIAASEELIEQASQTVESGDTNAIRLLLEKAVQAAPDFAEAKYWLGTLYVDQQNWEQAVSILEGALVDDPRNLAVRFKLGLAAFNAGQHEKARDACSRLLEISPDSPWHERASEVGRVADYVLSGGDIGDVVQGQKSPRTSHNEPDAQQALGLFLAANSVDECSQLVETHPDRFGAEFVERIRGLCQDSHTKKGASEARYVLAVKVNQFAIALKRAGIAGPAEDLFNLGIGIGRREESDALVAQALGNLGNLYRNRRAFDQAQRAFDEAGELFETSEHTEQALHCRFNAALITLELKKYKEAVEALSVILADCRRLDSTAGIVKCANNLALAYVGLDDFDRGVECAQVALNRNKLSEDASAYVESLRILAGCDCFRGRIRSGLAYLQSIPSLQARQQSAIALAQWSARRGQYEIALVFAEAALGMSEEITPAVCSIMSLAYKQLGQVALAEELLLEGQRIVQENGDHDGGRIIATELLALYLDQNYNLASRPGAFEKLSAIYEQVTKSMHHGEDRFLLSVVLANLGFTWHYLGKVADVAVEYGFPADESGATQYFERSIEITLQAAEIAKEIRDTEGEAAAENQLAMNYIELKQWEQAQTHLSNFMRVWTGGELDSPELRGRAAYNGFRVARALGRHEEAMRAGRECVEQIERLRGSAHSEPFLISIWSEWEHLFQEVIEYSIEQGCKEDALCYLECIKSRAFLDVLQQPPTTENSSGVFVNASDEDEITRQIERLEKTLGEKVDMVKSPGLIQRTEKQLGVARIRQRLANAAEGRRVPLDLVEHVGGAPATRYDGILETLQDT